jgi:hypothetical protein
MCVGINTVRREQNALKAEAPCLKNIKNAN